MTIEKILTFLKNNIHTVIMASNDEAGNPITCAVDIMLYENEKLYFLTARGKSFYKRLMDNGYIALTGIKGESTLTSISISLHGKVRNIGSKNLDKIFEENPYMLEIYPSKESQNVLEVFEIYDMKGEYFDLSKKPIVRQAFGNVDLKKVGYFINSNCIGCNICKEVCQQNCIDTSVIPAVIQQSHCLHCGKCKEVCGYNAI